MASVTTAWYDAQQTCFEYLLTETGSTKGVNGFIGDRLPDNKANLWCFIVSGGPPQIQNYQAPTPGSRYLTNGILRAQYEKLEDLMSLGSLIQQNMPAYKDLENPGQASGHVKNRGIPPNVSMFEVTTHPEIFSDVVEIKKQGSGDKEELVLKTYWIMVVSFRIAYTNEKQ